MGVNAMGPADVLPPRQVLPTREGRLGYLLSGTGEARIVLISGAGESLDVWAPLYPRIERLGVVFAWNRPGVEGSDAPKRPQTGQRVVASLRELLAHAGVHPPYVLVGHSVGGLHANLFARLHPQEVRALMFIEAMHPGDRDVLRRHEPQLARALGQVLSLPRRGFERNLHAEIACLEETARELEGAGSFPEVPLTVITGGQAPPAWLMSPAAAGARRAHQQDLARLSPQGEQVIAQRSGHFPQITEPELVLALLRRLIERSGARCAA